MNINASSCAIHNVNKDELSSSSSLRKMQINKIDTVPKLPELLRVAAYARVSNGKDAMLHSLSTQVNYYTELIIKNSKWCFGGVFVDEAITGTKDSRPEFQRLLAECRAGNIDMIITKSISRLARNTVTILSSVRELKNLNVDVFFEEQNIHSLSGDGELMLSILSSYAQEESRSCSENCKWRVRKNFKEGKIGGMTMFGFRLKNGQLQVVPEEAKIVKGIFTDYLSGMGVTAIVKKYLAKGFTFSRSGIAWMLRNEKFKGDMLLQKSFVEDHISKRKVKNIGQLPQYLVEGSHEAIIDHDTFAAVQAEIERRSKTSSRKAPVNYPFTGIIQCGKCGAFYKRKHANAGSKYEKIVWICQTYDMFGKSECNSQQIPENILETKVDEIGSLKLISEIRVPDKNHLTFVLKDGSYIESEWAHLSRKQSWTSEMREIAKQKSLERSIKHNET